jgi:phage baseplate assembly protein W
MIKLINTPVTLGLEGYAVTPEASFMDALTTPKGSVICNAKYGTKFHELKHRPFNSSWKIDFKRCLKDACSFDSRLSFDKVVLNDSEVDIGKLNFEVYTTTSIIKGATNV